MSQLPPDSRLASRTTFALGALVIAAIASIAAGCAQYYRAEPAPRLVVQPRVPLADIADSLFWRTLHAGQYDSIPRALLVMKAAYLQNPTDSRTAAHVAFLHAWRIAERARIDRVAPAITDDLILARRYFDQSILYEPAYDARIHGFAAVFRMGEADFHRDPALWEDGLRNGRKSVEAWPEFNWFTIGYALSTKPESSPHFKEALEMQWKTLESCGRTKVDRTNPTPEVLRGHGVVAEPALSDLREKCRLVTNTAVGANDHPVIVHELADGVGVVLNHRLIPRRRHRPQLRIQTLMHSALLPAGGGAVPP